MKEKPKKSVRMWVARDKDGSLSLYSEKPPKGKRGWGYEYMEKLRPLDSDLFPSVKWEDSEPTRVTLRLS